MSSEENKNPLDQFCSGATSSRYSSFAGETLVNATVIAPMSTTSRTPAMLSPRVGRVLLKELTGVVLAWKSYSIDRQVIVRNTELGNSEVILFQLNQSTTGRVIHTSPNLIVDRPLAVDTYSSCVISIDGIGYTINQDESIVEIVGTGWSTPSSLAFIDGYVLLSVKNSRQFLRSELNGTEFTDTINFSATQSEDNIKNIAAVNNQLYIFGERHVEVWWNSGATPDQPFSRQDGLGSQYGTVSTNTLVIDGIGYNGVRSETIRGVFIWEPTAKKISVDAVDFDLEGATDIVLHTSVENGRRFIHVLIDNKKLWSFDILSQAWHERTNQIPVDFVPDGERYYFVDSVGIHTITGNTDNDEIITCERQSPHITLKGIRMYFTMLEIDAAGDAGLMSLEYSNDSGRTWYNTGFSSATTLGLYNRYRFNRLGSSHDRVFKLTWTDVGIYAAYLTMFGGIR